MAPGAVGGTLGLGRLAANRVRADHTFLLALWLIILAATTLVATAFQYRDIVAIAGLQQVVTSAAPADRGISVQTTATVGQEPAFDHTVQGIIGKALGPAAVINLAARSSSLAPLGMDSGQAALHLTVLGSYTAIEDHAQLATGRWAVGGQDPVEATLSEGAARALGLKIGDQLALVDASVPGTPTAPLLSVVITGIWVPDPTDAYWFGDQLDLEGVLDEGTIAYRGPLMVAPEDLLARGLVKDLSLTWRADLVAGLLDPSRASRVGASCPRPDSHVGCRAPAASTTQRHPRSRTDPGRHPAIARRRGGRRDPARGPVCRPRRVCGHPRRRPARRASPTREPGPRKPRGHASGDHRGDDRGGHPRDRPGGASRPGPVGRDHPSAGDWRAPRRRANQPAPHAVGPGCARSGRRRRRRHDRVDRPEPPAGSAARDAPAGRRAGGQPGLVAALWGRSRPARRRRRGPLAAARLWLAGHRQRWRAWGQPADRRRAGDRPGCRCTRGNTGLAPDRSIGGGDSRAPSQPRAPARRPRPCPATAPFDPINAPGHAGRGPGHVRPGV